MIALVFLFLFLFVVLLICDFSGEVMVMEFVNKYRYGIYFVLAISAYLLLIELFNSPNIRPSMAADGHYVCDGKPVEFVVLMNDKFKPLLFVDKSTSQGYAPKQLNGRYGKCIPIEAGTVGSITPDYVLSYIPQIEAANEEGQYE